MPSFSSDFCSWLVSSLSIPGTMAGKYSTILTAVPNRAYTEPSSRPITPPPIMVKRDGISVSESASLEVIIRFPSVGNSGNGVGIEPVAMIIRSAVSSVVFPALSVTRRDVELRNVPIPWNRVILFF